MAVYLPQSCSAIGTPAFEVTLKCELASLDPGVLPLQQGLSQSSHVADSKPVFTLLGIKDADDTVHVKVAVLYAGVIAGSCCADDPSPVCEQPEYCELMLEINRFTAATRVRLQNA